MADQKAASRLDYAKVMVGSAGYVVCVCGQMFFKPKPYAEHVDACEHAERGVAAQGKVGFDRDA